MLAKGMKPDEVDRIAPHRVFSGNRPSVTILYKTLDPYTLGRLIALYEHRVFVEGAAVRHQFLRPVGRRTRQGTGDRPAAGRGGQGGCRRERCLDRRAGAPYPRSCARGVSEIGRHQGHPVRQGRHAGRFQGDLVRDRRPAGAGGGGRRPRAGRALLADAGYDFAAGMLPAPIRSSPPAPMPTSWRSGTRMSTTASAQAMVAGFDTFTAEAGRGAMQSPLPGSTEAIASLHALGFRLGVATNDSTGGAEKTLLALGVAQMFDAAYGYDAVANPKPAPDSIIAFCDLTGLKPSRDRHGRRQPPRSRNGEGRRRRPGRRRAVRHRHARNAGAAGRCDAGFDRRPAGVSGGQRRGGHLAFASARLAMRSER